MESSRVAKEVGGRLGEVVEVEDRRKQEDPNYFMRVKVALPISKPLRRGGFIAGSDGERSWVTFKYERLPMFYHYCGLLGHDLRHCASHFTATKSGSEMSYQYSEWLKSIGGRSISPTKRYAEKKSDKGVGNGVRRSGQSSGSAAEKSPNENPKESGRRVDDETEISRNVTDSALRISELNAVVEADTEIIGGVNGELKTDRKLTTGNLEGDETAGDNASNECAIISKGQADMDYVVSNMHDGPEVTKPKST